MNSKLYIAIAILIVALGVGYKYMSMQAEIVEQSHAIENQEEVISIMTENIIATEMRAEDTKKKEVFEAVSKTKKKALKEKISYDKSTSNDINSTKFFL